MKNPLPAALIGMMLLCISTGSIADVLSKDYLEHRFANMTVKGFHNKKNFAFTRYYYPDGTVIARSEANGDRVGRWRMQADTMCEQFGSKEKCRKVEERNGVIYKYNKKGKKIVTYGTFTEGNDLYDHPYVQGLATK